MYASVAPYVRHRTDSSVFIQEKQRRKQNKQVKQICRLITTYKQK